MVISIIRADRFKQKVRLVFLDAPYVTNHLEYQEL